MAVIRVAMTTIGWICTDEHDLDMAHRARSRGLNSPHRRSLHCATRRRAEQFSGLQDVDRQSCAAAWTCWAPVHSAAPFRRASNSNN